MGTSASSPSLAEIWVFPVKGCQGVRVDEWELAPTGMAYDRHWCIVDRNGTRYPEREYLSGRKLPKLATIGVAFVGSGASLRVLLTADGMPPLELPTDPAAYEDEEALDVRCCGVSTTDPQASGWELGSIPSRSAGPRAEQWITEYLHRDDVETDPLKRRLPRARYMIARGMPDQMRSVSQYAGQNATMGLEGQSLKRIDARPGDGVAFQDWAPFLLTSRDSAKDLARRMGSADYPTLCGRGNLVVEGSAAWTEEDWLQFTIGQVPFRKLKECPRCNVPNRDQTTGDFLFEGGSYKGAKGSRFLPMATLRRAFPEKADDNEWGIWKGPFFGVYVGHDSARATLRCGAPIVVQKRRPNPQVVMALKAGAVAGVLLAAAWGLFRRGGRWRVLGAALLCVGVLALQRARGRIPGPR